MIILWMKPNARLYFLFLCFCICSCITYRPSVFIPCLCGASVADDGYSSVSIFNAVCLQMIYYLYIHVLGNEKRSSSRGERIEHSCAYAPIGTYDLCLVHLQNRLRVCSFLFFFCFFFFLLLLLLLLLLTYS